MHRHQGARRLEAGGCLAFHSVARSRRRLRREQQAEVSVLLKFVVLAVGTDYGHPVRKFTARPRINSQSKIFRYGRSIFCLPLRPNFSDIFDLCLHWVSVVRAFTDLTEIPKKILTIFVATLMFMSTDYGHPMKAYIKDI